MKLIEMSVVSESCSKVELISYLYDKDDYKKNNFEVFFINKSDAKKDKPSLREI
jgi:hypothetical protein